LIAKLPRENQHLLLYILDLLAVFSSKSRQNLMPSKNLASIFQPGILSHPDHDMDPDQYKLSQEVLGFLIDYQNYFLMSLPTTLQNSLSNGGQEDNITTTTSNNEEARLGANPKEIRHNNSRRISSVGESGLKEPDNLNNLPVTPLSLRRSSLSELRNKSADSITLISNGNNGQGMIDDTQQGLQDPSLIRKNTGSGLTRSRTLPSKKSEYGETRGRAASTTGGSNGNDISRP